MKKAKFTVRGTTIYLYHKFNLEALTNTKKPKEGSAGNNPAEWKTTAWIHDKQFFIPGYYFFSSIIQGGKYVKVGRGTISKQLPGIFSVLDERVMIDRFIPKDIEELELEDLGTDSSQNVFVDIRMVANPNTKGRNARYRIALRPEWRGTVHIEWDDTVFSKSQIHDALIAAGKYSGVGDGRAIGYSRYAVEDFEVYD